MKNKQPMIYDSNVKDTLLAKLIILFISAMTLTACGEETTYDEFGRSYHNLLFDSNNYDAYLTSSRPQSSGFFYPCLDKNLARHNNEAQLRINACNDRCANDAVCNFDCNTQQGTEFFEARRDLLELKKATIRQNLDTTSLKSQGFFQGEIDCLSINTVRSFEGLPALSCAQIANEFENQYISENRCVFEKNQGFLEQIFGGGDWEIK